MTATSKVDLFESGANPLGNKETGQLRSFIDRIEKLEEERKSIGGDVKEVYEEASGAGLDKKAMRRIIAIRKKDREKWQEEENKVDAYLLALGLI